MNEKVQWDPGCLLFVPKNDLSCYIKSGDALFCAIWSSLPDEE